MSQLFENASFWGIPSESRAARIAQVASDLKHLAASSAKFKDFAQQAVDLMVEEFELYFVGLYLLDPSGQWAVFTVGTGEHGPAMVECGHKLRLSSCSLVSEAITRRAICVGGASPIMGFFYIVLPDDMQLEPLGPFQFAEAFLGCPLLPETRLEVVFPLRTPQGVLGALELHNVYDPQGNIHLFLPVADDLASLCAAFTAETGS